jgi:hypothetical protein
LPPFVQQSVLVVVLARLLELAGVGAASASLSRLPPFVQQSVLVVVLARLLEQAEVGEA